MKIMRKIIKIDDERCDGCGQCVPGCAEGALQIVDGKARMISENLCDGLGACIGECPNDAMKIIEREADDFDEAAVEKHLSEQQKAEAPPAMGHVCPSAAIHSFTPPSPCQAANKPGALDGGESALSHWPIQIRLIPPTAPFLKGADLLVLADCCGAAYPGLHEELIKGRVVMMGCPKFDDVQDYIDKFAAIFKVADIKSVTSAVMEVPCCAGLPVIVQKGMEAAEKTIPMETVVIGLKGQRKERDQ